MVVVAALNANNTASTYSSAGSSVWVSSYGGEYGTTNPAIMTVDQASCSKGYVSSNYNNSNAFNNSSSTHPENPNCNYTSTFNGTSSAAPNVSGVVALILKQI